MSYGKIVLMACGSFSPPTYMHLRMFEIAKDHFHSLNLGTVVGGVVSPVHDAYGKKDLVAAHHRIAMLKLGLRSSAWVKVSDWETRQAGWTRTRVSLAYHQDTINSRLTEDPPAWLPDDILNNSISLDEPDNLAGKLNGNTNRIPNSGSFRSPGNYRNPGNFGLPGNLDNVLSGVDNRMDSAGVTVKLLCGADLLESFATPGLWSDEDIEAIVGRHGLVVVTRGGGTPDKFIYESDILYKHRKNITLITNHVANEVSSTVIRRIVRRGDSAKYLTDDAILAYIRQHSLYGTTGSVTEYNTLNEMIASYDQRSPQDTIMASPEEANFKNILISIRDRPTIVDETITVKKPRKSNYLLPYSHTDFVSPILDATPKMAYVDKVPPSYKPGKAVKIVSDASRYNVEDQVSLDNTYSSLDSYLSAKEDVDVEIYKRRVSDGNLVPANGKEHLKKRCSSSTIRKLTGKKPESMAKSRSEVSKLCERMRNAKLRDKESGRNYKTRSCNDIIRLVLTKHGIHVISDTEAIV